MCRCWLRCWEDFYWNCIEEKFCYDETIANYNPEEDDHYQKKSGHGFLSAGKLENNNSAPVCNQPPMNGRSFVSAGKIHEEDYREIQTNAPILAPEIMSVFSNSQIFHENHPVVLKKPSSTPAAFPGVHGGGKSGREADSDKLLFRLEGPEDSTYTATLRPIHTVDTSADRSSSSSLANSKTFPSIREELETDGAEVILRPHVSNNSLDVTAAPPPADGASPPMNKRLRNVRSVPYFPFRPASETDIFAITGSMGQISMTPEIPSISYSTLPKHYEDTPTIGEYKESVSLHSIQTAQSARMSQLDFSMPRYFRRTAAAAAGSVDNLSASTNGGSSGSGSGSGGGVRGAVVFSNPGGESTSSSSTGGLSKGAEMSKRLKLLRTKLPPLSINLGGGRERSKDKGIE